MEEKMKEIIMYFLKELRGKNQNWEKVGFSGKAGF